MRTEMKPITKNNGEGPGGDLDYKEFMDNEQLDSDLDYEEYRDKVYGEPDAVHQ